MQNSLIKISNNESNEKVSSNKNTSYNSMNRSDRPKFKKKERKVNSRNPRISLMFVLPVEEPSVICHTLYIR